MARIRIRREAPAGMPPPSRPFKVTDVVRLSVGTETGAVSAVAVVTKVSGDDALQLETIAPPMLTGRVLIDVDASCTLVPYEEVLFLRNTYMHTLLQLQTVIDRQGASTVVRDSLNAFSRRVLDEDDTLLDEEGITEEEDPTPTTAQQLAAYIAEGSVTVTEEGGEGIPVPLSRVLPQWPYNVGPPPVPPNTRWGEFIIDPAVPEGELTVLARIARRRREGVTPEEIARLAAREEARQERIRRRSERANRRLEADEDEIDA